MSPLAKRSSTSKRGCTAFCVLSSVLCFFFAHLMSSGNVAMAIAAQRHHWVLEDKATAVRRAAFLYLFFALLMWFWPTVSRLVGAPQVRTWIEARVAMLMLQCSRRMGLSKRRLTYMRHGDAKGSDDELSSDTSDDDHAQLLHDQRALSGAV